MGAWGAGNFENDTAMDWSGGVQSVEDLRKPEVKAIAAQMTFACATDGNHGRSVAQGAGLVGARSVIFVHSGVSNERVAAIARFGVGEERALSFCSPYGCSKGGADQYVLDFSRTYDIPAVVFRMSCIYGPHQCGNEDQG